MLSSYTIKVYAACRILFSIEVFFFSDVIALILINLVIDLFAVQSDDFKAGVTSIAKLLKVSAHPDHLVTLEACSKLVCDRLNSSALADPSTVVAKGKPFPIMDTDLGFDMGDRMLNNAGKALSLLYIQDLRNLQTRINEAIVGVQSITANPKTDTKLGKVGM